MLTIKSLEGLKNWNAYGCEVNCTCSKILCVLACGHIHARTVHIVTDIDGQLLMHSVTPASAYTLNICCSLYSDSFENFRCTQTSIECAYINPLSTYSCPVHPSIRCAGDYIVRPCIRSIWYDLLEYLLRLLCIKLNFPRFISGDFGAVVQIFRRQRNGNGLILELCQNLNH